jgi:hypothetical protein
VIKVSIPYGWGDVLYLRDDVEQLPHRFVGIVFEPTGTKFKLSYCGEIVEVFDFETSEEMNMALVLNYKAKDE